MGNVEIANRKILLLKVRAMTGKVYFLALLYIPKPGWIMCVNMRRDMKELWGNPDLLTPERCNELEEERFYIYQVPTYTRGAKKGTPKWKRFTCRRGCKSLREAVAWIKAEVIDNVLTIIDSDPDVLRGADNKGTQDKT